LGRVRWRVRGKQEGKKERKRKAINGNLLSSRSVAPKKLCGYYDIE
jgi:hypothetical protein